MQEVEGVYLPDGDEHMAEMLRARSRDRVVVDGKATYQYRKIAYAVELCRDANRLGLAVDVGAHVGLWSMILAKNFARVAAFEPMRDHVECLRLNCPDNVEVHRVALSSQRDTLMVWIDRAFSGDAHVSAVEGVKVRAAALDSYALSPDLLKLDVEGFESPVLIGAADTIMIHRPVVVVEQKGRDEELHGFPRDEARRILERWGYEVRHDIGGDLFMTHPETAR